MYCPNCGEAAPPNSAFCPKCGAKLPTDNSEEAQDLQQEEQEQAVTEDETSKAAEISLSASSSSEAKAGVSNAEGVTANAEILSDAKTSHADTSIDSTEGELTKEANHVGAFSSSAQSEQPSTKEISENANTNINVANNGKVKEKKPKNKKVIIIVTIIAVIVIALAVVAGVYFMNEAKEEKYEENLESITYSMLQGASEAETAGNLIKSVWYNSIWEERDSETDQYTMEDGVFLDDFNDALNNLESDEDFMYQIAEIQSYQDDVVAKMQEMSDPPKKYETAYQALQDYYDAFISFTNLVINPNGSLQSFSSEFNNSDDEVLDTFTKMKLYLEVSDEDDGLLD